MPKQMNGTMKPAELEKAGRCLHGPNWKSPLARDIDMTYRQMLRYSRGDAVIPTSIAYAVRYLLIVRGKARGRADVAA